MKRTASFLAALVLALALPASAVDPSFKAPTITPEELAKTLRAEKAEKPVLLHVGFRVLFAQAHIPGSKFVGPGRDGIALLKKAVASVPKDRAIVLYCGCCPWARCPNIEPAWSALKEDGFSNVKVLLIPQNLGADWVSKGYPVEKADA
jgi:rhodanese-related sulfurtransferase